MKIKYSLLLIILVSIYGFGQTEIINETLRIGTIPNGWTQTNISFETTSGGYSKFVSSTAVLTTETFDANAFTSIDINFDVAKFGSGGNGPLSIEYSTDDGLTWNFAANSTIPTNSNYDSNSINITNLSSTMKIRFLRILSPSQKRLRDVIIIGNSPPGPDNPNAFTSATISTSQIDLIYEENTEADDIVIVFNTTNSFSTPSGTPPAVGNAFVDGTVLVQTTTGSATYNHVGLTENTTYYYRAYSYDGANYSTALSATSTTLCTIPTDVTSLTSVSDNTLINLSWTNETCFDELLVIATENSSITAMPNGDGSAYTANPAFGLGTDFGNNEYVVYKDNGSSVTVTGLVNSTSYLFKVFARKGTSWSTGVAINATPNSILNTGNIIITEIMKNPNDVSDLEGEYFEIYNTSANPIEMLGWRISDNGSDFHNISSSLVVPAHSFAVLGRNADIVTNGGVTIDYEYSNFNLSNGNDEIILNDQSLMEIDRVAYDNVNFPNPNGAAMIYTGSDIEDNSDSSLWSTATISEGINIDFGSPGINGIDQIVAFLVFVNDSWNTVPSASTATRTGLIKSNESTSFNTDIALDNLLIEEGSDLTINSGNTLTVNNLTLESQSDSYSSLILNGTIIGTVKYKRFVNSNSNGNDLISPPLSGETWNDFLNSDSNSTDLFNDGNTNLTTYAFGPFDKTLDSFLNYTDATSANLISGIGYRAATTNNGANLTFTGNVPTGSISVNIIDSGAIFPDWNLIGNPYPSYISIADFLNYETAPGIKNIDILEDISGIYGYDGNTSDGWDIITLANAGSRLMAPGQGFFVAADDADVASYDITFNKSMRKAGSEDDFILNRNSSTLTFLKLNASTTNYNYNTEFYFNTNSSLGLDLGYDGKILGNTAPSFALYSHLVENNTGIPIALQALNLSDLNGVSIPLGVNSNQGEQITFSINTSTLPNDINIYLEDNVTNTYTLLTSSDYVLTPIANLNGTGRFYLHFTNSVLSTLQNTLDNLSIYNNKDAKTIVINGQLSENTVINIYDIQGRIVSTKSLQVSSNRSQSIDVSHLITGIYLIKLKNISQNKTQKMIIN